jgi:hypothetical protein
MQAQYRTVESAATGVDLRLGNSQADAHCQALHIMLITAVSLSGEGTENRPYMFTCQHILVILQADGETDLLLITIGVCTEVGLV